MAGLDNPDWQTISLDQPGNLDGEGYVFDIRTSDVPYDSDVFLRSVAARMSFRETIRFSRLAFGWYTDRGASSFIYFQHALGTLPVAMTNGLVLTYEPFSTPSNSLTWLISEESTQIPLMPDDIFDFVELGIEYNVDRSAGWY